MYEDMDQKKANRGLLGVGVFAAIAASLCCITPVLAFLSGVAGLASVFSWMEPARPWLIFLSIGILGFAWYRKLKPQKPEKIHCNCEEDEKTPFLRSKTFLTLVTVLAVMMITFPYYGSIVYPENQTRTVIVPANQVATVAFQVKGMTCTNCEEHIRHGVNSLNGIIDVTADYTTGKTVVRFDRDQTNDEEIRRAIDATGYKVENKEDLQ